MDKSIDRSVNEFLDLIKTKYHDVESVYLFGSYAKGSSTNDSDIDIALIFKNLIESRRFDLQVQLMMMAAKIDSRIEPHPLSVDDFNSDSPFIMEIKRTGIEWAA